MKLSDKVKIHRPNTTSREFLSTTNGIKCVHYGDVYKNYSGKTIYSSSIINCYTQTISVDRVLTCDSIIVPDVTETVADWGHFVYIRYDGTPYVNGTHTFALLSNSSVTLQYLFRYLSSEKNRFRLQSLLNGSTVFQISLANFNVFELLGYHENEPEQQHIVDILGSFDDKVENNEKIVRKTHELAMLYYKDFFSNENKEITLSNITAIVMGQAPDGSSYNENGDGVPFYQGRTDFGLMFPSQRLSTTAPMRFAKEGDVLFSVRAPVGDVNIADSDSCIGRGLAAIKNTLGLKNNAAIYYSLIASHSIFDVFNGSGTVFGCIGKAELNNAKLKLGNTGKLMQFDCKVSALFDKCLSAMLENRKLVALKQTYLKKFFS